LTFTAMRSVDFNGIKVLGQIYQLIEPVRLGCGRHLPLPVGRRPAGRTNLDAFRCDVVVPHADSSRAGLRRLRP
jgi:hypothetical protein